MQHRKRVVKWATHKSIEQRTRKYLSYPWS